MFGFRRRKTLTRQDVVWCFANIMGRLEPMRAPEHRKIRVGKECDGGSVMLDDFTGIVAAYSIGISDEVSRDLDIAQRGIEVFQYDHTIPSAPLRHARLHWTRKGLGLSSTPKPSVPSALSSASSRLQRRIDRETVPAAQSWSQLGQGPQ
jgi:hypothetical protein